MRLKCGLEVYGIIYKIENTINHKVYIGQTTCKRGFRDRYRGSKKLLAIECVYRYNLRSSKSKRRNYNKHLFNSIKKYGFNNFKVNEIFDVAFSKKELDTKEKCWIRYYKSDFEEYGYNITAGGSGKIINNETRKRLKNEQREIYGREIYQLDSKTLNIIKKYKSISEATEELNLSRSSIKNVLNPNYRNITAGGYKWRYVSEQNIKYTEEYISKKKKKNNKELVISMYRNGISIHKISEYIGISEKTVKSYLAYEKKTKFINDKILQKKKEILQLFDEGHKPIEIIHMGYPSTTVRRTLSVNNRIKINHMKLTKEEMEIRNNKIIKLYNQGLKQCDIQRKLNLSRSIVQKVINKNKILKKEHK